MFEAFLELFCYGLVISTLFSAERPTSPASSRAPASLDVPDSRLPSPVSAVPDSSALSARPKSAFRLREEMRARESTVAHADEASEQQPTPAPAAGHHPSSEPPTLVGSPSEGTIDALLDIMDVHAERQLIKTGELDFRLEDVQNGVRDVAANLRVAVSGREEDSRNIAELCSVMGDLRSALECLSSKTDDIDVPKQEKLRTMVKNIAPGADAVDGEAKSSLLVNEKPSKILRGSHGTGIEQADISDIRSKLDALLELSAPLKNIATSKTLKLDSSRVRFVLSSSGRHRSAEYGE